MQGSYGMPWMSHLVLMNHTETWNWTVQGPKVELCWAMQVWKSSNFGELKRLRHGGLGSAERVGGRNFADHTSLPGSARVPSETRPWQGGLQKESSWQVLSWTNLSWRQIWHKRRTDSNRSAKMQWLSNVARVLCTASFNTTKQTIIIAKRPGHCFHRYVSMCTSVLQLVEESKKQL